MNISFKTTRNIGLLAMTAIIVITGLISFMATTRIVNGVSGILQKERPKLEMAEGVRNCFLDAEKIFRNFIQMPSRDINPGVALMNKAIKGSEELKKLVSEEEKEEMAKFITSAKRFRVALITYAEEAQVDITGARAMEMEKIALTTAGEAEVALSNLVRDVRAKIKVADESMLGIAKNNQRMSLAGMLIGIAAGLLVAIFMGRGLSRPIRQLVSGTQRIARGDLDYRVNVESGSEIGQLSDAFNKMTAGLAKEITERKKKEEDLRKAEELYRTLVENINMGISLIDKDHNIIAISAPFSRLFKKDPKDMVGRKCYQEFEKRPSVCPGCPAQETLTTGKPAETERRGILDDGSFIDARVSTFPVFDTDGIVNRFIEVVEDITERKKIEEVLKESEERFRIIFDNATDGILLADVGTQKFDFGNKTICQMLGYNEEEIKSVGVMDIHPQESLPYTIEQFEKLARKEIALVKDLPVKRKDGSVFYADISGGPAQIAGKAYLIGIFRDITERKKAEEEIKQNYETQNIVNRLLSFSLKEVTIGEILEYTLDLLFSLSWFTFESKGLILLVEDNPEVLVIKVQKGLPEPLQKRCALTPFGKCICGRAALTKKIQIVDRLDEQHEVGYEGMLPHGHYCAPILFAGRVLGVINMYVSEGCAHNQRVEEFLITVADVLAGIIVRKDAQEQLKAAYEQLKTTQSQLVQSAKMASVGLLAGGVAHEINNPLTGVLNNVQLIKMMMAESKKDFNLNDFSELLSTIEESALRCTKITRSLLDFSHVSKGIFQEVSVDDLVEKVAVLIGFELNLQNIIIQKEVAPGLPKILGDLQLLQQVVFDILSNAKWAIQKKSGKDGGTITIKTEYDAQNRRIFIYIQDTGIGIPKENLERMFEPFFTTKPVGEGTGLGLSIAYNIIKQHNGTIEVESQVNQGTTFKISLPAI